MAQTIITDIHEMLTMQGAYQKKGRGPMGEADLGLLKKQALVMDGDKILWIGPKKRLPREFHKIRREIRLDKNLFPGWIDCHTHSLFAGDRVHEFEMKIAGKSYQEIAALGGGIQHTVRETRKSSTDTLQKLLSERLNIFLKQGATTVEVKTGYGLSTAQEMRLLKAIQGASSPVKVVPTFLGAHALGPEEKDRRVYLQKLMEVLPQIRAKKLAARVDIFIEQGYFSAEEARPYLQAAKTLGFDLTIHADQMSHGRATALAVELGARSADHVIFLEADEQKAVAKSEVTCVFLPTSDFYLKWSFPPARQLIDLGARFALSTDFNPGTSPTQNIQWVGLLARREMRMSLPEVFSAWTVGASYALGREQSCGSLRVGATADFFSSEQEWNQMFYDLNPVCADSVWVNGRREFSEN